jgi:hypothetical protein
VADGSQRRSVVAITERDWHGWPGWPPSWSSRKTRIGAGCASPGCSAAARTYGPVQYSISSLRGRPFASAVAVLSGDGAVSPVDHQTLGIDTAGGTGQQGSRILGLALIEATPRQPAGFWPRATNDAVIARRGSQACSIGMVAVARQFFTLALRSVRWADPLPVSRFLPRNHQRGCQGSRRSTMLRTAGEEETSFSL